ncbi:MAG: SMC family ATPase [Clostridia bacterium]|nr:SMC family ATPase [Clostridia bacterium]
MRPKKLTMSAFGPYAKTTVLDFDLLGPDRIYLITGDTGAGKTTIFDAIAYALYGKASGDTRDAAMLRSKYADSGTKTEVELVFDYRGREYTVKRSPRQMRPKKRGEGLKADDELSELILPDGRVFTAKKEVDERIKEILGVDREQFSQIAMIAQGEFRKLLLAGTEDRQKIFRKIFGTDAYRDFQNRLKDKVSELKRECDSSEQSVLQYMSAAQCGEENPLYADFARLSGSEHLADEFAELLKRLIDEDEAGEKAVGGEIEKADDALIELNKKLAKADERIAAKKALERTADELSAAHQRLKEAEEELSRANDQRGVIEESQNAAKEIEHSVPDYDKSDDLLKRLAQSEKEAKRLIKEAESAKETLSSLEKKLGDQKNERRGLDNAGENRARLTAEKQALAERKPRFEAFIKQCAALDNLKAALSLSQREYMDAETKAAADAENEERLRRAFNANRAGIMASELSDGDPCPVCGSTVHPNKAKKTVDAPSEADVEKAEKQAEKARKNASAKSVNANTIKGQYDAAQEALKKSQSELFESECPDDAASAAKVRVSDINAEIRALDAKIKAEDDNIKRKEALDRLIPETEDAIKATRDELSEKSERKTALEASQAELKEQIENLRGRLKYESKLHALRKKEELENMAQRLRKDIEAAEAKCGEQKSGVAGLTGKLEEQKKAAEGDSSDIGAIEKEKQAASEEIAAVSEKKSMLQAERDAIVARRSANEYALKNTAVSAKKLKAKNDELSLVKDLSDTANGTISGEDKVTLETYILMTYFERILKRANVHLFRMSSQQYEFCRSTSAESKRSQSGLDLDVRDHYNGSVRSVKSLSGGESFIASLSLALGMSEEITASAGGVHLDAMFVDEGFGSLDPDTLNEAMKALNNLTENDRLVGIISHVTELRGRIDKQIVVTKEKSGGSRIEIKV